MKIAIYSRKSKFTGKGESIENQVVLCREYIQRNIPDAKDSDILVYEDEGFSAKNLDRPQFRMMMQSARKQPFDYIVVYQQKCRRFRNAHRRTERHEYRVYMHKGTVRHLHANGQGYDEYCRSFRSA